MATSRVTDTTAPSQLAHAPTAVSPSPAAQVVTGYLDAVRAGDCVSAERYTEPKLFMGNGDLCLGQKPGPIRFDRWRSDPALAPAHPSADVYEYGVEIHVTSYGPQAGGIGSTGWHTWFLQAQKQADGFRLIGGGSGP